MKKNARVTSVIVEELSVVEAKGGITGVLRSIDIFGTLWFVGQVFYGMGDRWRILHPVCFGWSGKDCSMGSEDLFTGCDDGKHFLSIRGNFRIDLGMLLNFWK